MKNVLSMLVQGAKIDVLGQRSSILHEARGLGSSSWKIIRKAVKIYYCSFRKITPNLTNFCSIRGVAAPCHPLSDAYAFQRFHMNCNC